MRKILNSVLTLGLLCFAGHAMAQNMPVRHGAGMKQKLKAEIVSYAGMKQLPSPMSEGSGVTAMFSCKAQSSEAPVWSENFDSGAAGWTFHNTSNVEWSTKKITGTTSYGDKDFSTIMPGDVYSLFVEGPYRISSRDTASVVSPEIAVPVNGTLKGYVGFSQNFDDECRLIISVSDDNFATQTEVWNSGDETGDKYWRWHEMAISLSAYAGKNVRIKLTYGPGAKDTFNVGGYMGDFAVDGLTVNGVSEVTGISVETGEMVELVDMSAGEPTAWEWSFPGGVPATSNEQNPTVYYTKDGVYDVSLTASNANGSDTKTIKGFVTVTGKAPVAHIVPPATFKYASTRLPMVAPLAPVQYSDGSEHFPTSWNWTFSGVSPTAGEAVESEEENPVVNYNFLHEQSVALKVANEHGESADTLQVSAEYAGVINNLQKGDYAATFNLDGRGVFPGSNTMKITAYAEKFSKPSRPILVSGAYVYFVQAKVSSLLDQIADVGVHLYTSKDGLPDKKVESTWWRVIDLDLPGATGSMVGTSFAFNPQVVDDEFFIVVDGIPESNDSTQVTFAMADFRASGNTAYMLKDGKWVDVSTYFPAGKNHTSYCIMPVIAHSVMAPLTDDGSCEVNVGPESGVAKFKMFSYLGYQTPVKSDASWCRVIGEPNGYTVDELQISYDALPEGVEQREAILTVTDSLSEMQVKVIQTASSDMAAVEVSKAKVTPTVFSTHFTVALPANAKRVEVVDMQGAKVFDTAAQGEASIDVATEGWAQGVYCVRVTTDGGAQTIKCVKKY